MNHPNVDIVRRFYERFAQGDTQAIDDHFSDTVLFVPAGKYSLLAGVRRGASAILEFMEQQLALTDGSWIPQPIDILATDRHTVVLVAVEATRNGRSAQFRLVHVWHFDNGVVTALHSYVDDQYLYDEFFT